MNKKIRLSIIIALICLIFPFNTHADPTYDVIGDGDFPSSGGGGGGAALGQDAAILKAVGFQTGLAWILATCVYQIGSRLELGTISIIDILFNIIS